MDTPTQSGPGTVGTIAACTTGAARDYLSEFALLRQDTPKQIWHQCTLVMVNDGIALPTLIFLPLRPKRGVISIYTSPVSAWKLERRFDAALFINRKVYCGHFETQG